jgi:Rrf2 family transcriptional regulator, cysteine metabolism repressor
LLTVAEVRGCVEFSRLTFSLIGRFSSRLSPDDARAGSSVVSVWPARDLMRVGCAGRMADSGAGRERGNAPRSLRSAAMISITTKSPYALNALVELYRQGGSGPVPIAELARRRQIPVQFLEHLFATLRRAGILRSQRGVKGGYSFARPPEEVTVLELVELLDGPVGVGALGVFAEAAQAAASVLREATVASIAEEEIRSAGAPMYHI